MHQVRGHGIVRFTVLPLLILSCLCLGSLCCSADEIAAGTVVVSKGAAAETFDVQVEKAKLSDVVAALAREAGVSIKLFPGLQERTVERLDLKGFPLSSVLLALAEQNPRLKVSRDDVGWVLWELQPTPPGTRQIECSLKVMDVRRADVEALFAAHVGDADQFRLPGGVALLRGQFNGAINAALSKGLATVVNEPHVITGDGQEAEISFHTSGPETPAPEIVLPGFVCGGLERSFLVLPRRVDDGVVSVGLSLSTAWYDTAPQPAPGERNAPRRPLSAYALITKLPQITLTPEQQLLVRGWPGATTPAEGEAGRETIAILTAVEVLGEER